MGGSFSCFVPKPGRLKKTQQTLRKQKKSKLQKLFETNDVKLQQELLDVHWATITGETLAEEIGEKNKTAEEEEEEEIVVEDLCSNDTEAVRYYKVTDNDNTDTDHSTLKKIFHGQTEDWDHFHTELAREYTEQLEDDFGGGDFTDAAAEDFDDGATELGKELLDLILAKVDDIEACRERALRAEKAFKAFKDREWRAKHTPGDLSDSDDSDDCEDERWTPPLIEGEIYTGHGILKKFANRNENHNSGVRWAPGVKPPASDLKELGKVMFN